VLIVENEAIVRMELAERLATMGLTALAAGDADEAIRILETHPEIDVLMTDIAMPGSMDGARLAHHVRRRWPPVKIIVVSGYGDTPPADLPRRALFLAKPYWPDALANALDRMINGGGPRAAPALAGPRPPFLQLRRPRSGCG
jgi:CheY-like chemotaxis protein